MNKLSLLDPFETFLGFAFKEERRKDPVNITLEYDDESYHYRVVAPGFAENELSVDVNNNMLTISGKHEENVNKKNYHSSSRNSFSQTYILPQNVTTNDVKAEYKSGILVVSLQKKSKTLNAKNIPIKSLKE